MGQAPAPVNAATRVLSAKALLSDDDELRETAKALGVIEPEAPLRIATFEVE